MFDLFCKTFSLAALKKKKKKKWIFKIYSLCLSNQQNKQVSNLVFYTQSTITVISKWSKQCKILIKLHWVFSALWRGRWRLPALCWVFSALWKGRQRLPALCWVFSALWKGRQKLPALCWVFSALWKGRQRLLALCFCSYWTLTLTNNA